MTDDRSIDYPSLIRESLRSVVRTVLERVVEEGLPGEHHFYISFATGAPGVEAPAVLSRQYPEEATIVLQRQFWDLEVDDEAFSVTLRFGGTPQRVKVPFASLTSFVDPEAKLGLRFDAEAPNGDSPPPQGGDGDPSDKVVSLDDFRSKKS